MSVSFRSNIALKNENPKLRKISVKTKLLKERNSVVQGLKHPWGVGGGGWGGDPAGKDKFPTFPNI